MKSIYNKKLSVSNNINESINYKSIFDSIKNKYDLTGQKDGGKCNEVSDYIEKYFNLPKIEVSVLKIDGSNIIPISIGNHYVNKDGDKLIDFTLPQYSKYLNKRYEDIPIPNIAIYDKEEDCYKSDLVTYVI